MSVSNKSELTGKIFDRLIIEERVVMTSAKTISISAIATISVGKIESKSNVFGVLFGIGILLLAIAMFVEASSGYRASQALGPGAAVAAIFGAIVLLASLNMSPDRHYLVIGTSDGERTFFSGKKDFLQDVRTNITKKINEQIVSATYNIDFSTGKIENTGGGTVVSGDNNAVASGENAKAGTADVTANTTISNSAGVVAGVGHSFDGGYATGDNSATHQEVRYADGTEKWLAEWRAFLAQNRENDYIVRRIEDLENQVRRRSPTPEDKQSVRAIVGDLMAAARDYSNFVDGLRAILSLVM